MGGGLPAQEPEETERFPTREAGVESAGNREAFFQKKRQRGKEVVNRPEGAQFRLRKSLPATDKTSDEEFEAQENIREATVAPSSYDVPTW